MVSGIYIIKNTQNGNFYIGSSVNFTRRFSDHRKTLCSRTHFNEHLQRAWDKYGQESFQFIKIIICAPIDLLMYEQRAIDIMKPQYNLCPKAGSTLGKSRPDVKGVAFTDEHKSKISESLKGKKKSEEHRRNLSISKKNSPDVIARLRALAASQRGKKLSPDVCARMSKARIGNKSSLGFKQSPQTIAKRVAAIKARRCAL